MSHDLAKPLFPLTQMTLAWLLTPRIFLGDFCFDQAFIPIRVYGIIIIYFRGWMFFNS